MATWSIYKFSNLVTALRLQEIKGKYLQFQSLLKILKKRYSSCW